ncbi:MAG TPA: Photosystem I reaction center subunit III [Allocoleopsis sp.]
MPRLFALALIVCLWLGFTPAASADVSGLTPCRDTPAFNQRLSNSVRGQEARLQKYDANSSSAAIIHHRIDQTKDRFARYGDALCGPEGLPHLIVDGRLDHAGEFLIPSALFLLIAGWIGWVGRAYLQSVKKTDSPEMKEIIIDVPRAIGFMLTGFTWPLAALKEFTTGELTAKEEEIPVSPR